MPRAGYGGVEKTCTGSIRSHIRTVLGWKYDGSGASARAAGSGTTINIIDGKNHKMAADKTQNLQDVFLNNIRKNKTPVTIFLVNGVKLQGIVTWFDNFSVLLRRDNHSQLVYKHAISTVMPATPVQLWEGDEDEASDAAEAETDVEA